jgi:subtilisin family serine protease
MKHTLRLRLWIGFAFLTMAGAGIVPDRYIVELSSEPVAGRIAARGRGVNRLEAERRRADVRSEQARAKLAIQQAGGEVLDSLDTVANAILVRIPAGQAAQLAGLPGVKRVYPMREFKLLLDRAVVVHKVVDAWNQIGLDKAGAGIKIGIIDTGIDNTHPAFQEPSLAMPAGFPKVNQNTDATFTNHKVIVARSYVNLLKTDPDLSARDDEGHGTGVAMTAAGVLNAGPLATIRGVAPVAYLGNYKIFGSPGVNDTTNDGAILKAIDDAVADGMDVINLSLGVTVAIPLAEDLEASTIERATSMGVIVVVAGGNGGPDPQTFGPPATAPFAISVGASVNDRTFSATATVGGVRYEAVPGSGPAPAQAVTARIKDITTLGDNGLACSPMPAGSLTGSIVLVLRGTCFFTDKLHNVQAGGAVGALVYTDAARPDAIVMSVGAATLPAMMVSNGDGVSVKHQLSGGAKVTATLDFNLQAISVDPDKLADFSAEGPNLDGSIKPDLVAVGMHVYTAAQNSDPKGDLYNASRYLAVDGTSFSSPIVAGAAALLKAARPGLTVAEYRSLLINSAGPAYFEPNVPARVQQAGAGILDMSAALRASGAEAPTSLSFGIGNGTTQQTRTLTISNATNARETFTILVAGRDMPTGPVPPDSRTAMALETSAPLVTVSTHSLTLEGGASGTVTVGFSGFGLAAGAYEGFIRVLGTNSNVEQRVPYWYGVGSTVPARITILNTPTNPKAGAVSQGDVLFRVTDASGITVPGVHPTATVVDGGGKVLSVENDDPFLPGVFALNVQLGAVAGSNDFQIRVGNLTQTVTIVTP